MHKLSSFHAWAMIALTAIVLGYLMLFMRGATAQENWYHAQEVNPSVRERLNLASKSCCGEGDTYKTRFRLVNDGTKYGTETYEYWKDDKWHVVPPDIITRAPTPDGRPVLFMRARQDPICLIIDREGG